MLSFSTFGVRTVTLAIELRGPATTAAVIVVLDATLDTVESIATTVQETVRVDVVPGKYLIEGRLPSGERVRKLVLVRDATKIALEFASTENEWMGAARSVDRTLRASRQVQERESVGASPPVRYELASWILDPNTKVWRKALQAPDAVTENDQSFLFAVRPAGPSVQLLEVRREPDGAGALVVLPSAHDELSIYLHKHAAPQASFGEGKGASPSVRMTITRGRWGARFDGLLSFLHQGDLQNVDRDATASAAEKQLQAKVNDPIGAALGGYVLLRLRALDRLHDWTANLCRLFPWLPDGKIIRAWHLLLLESSSESSRQVALGLLGEAFALGPPVFAEGIRRLNDGLAFVEELDPDRVRSLRHALREPLMAWIRSRPLSTFDIRAFPTQWDSRLDGFDAWRLPRSLGNP